MDSQSPLGIFVFFQQSQSEVMQALVEDPAQSDSSLLVQVTSALVAAALIWLVAQPKKRLQIWRQKRALLRTLRAELLRNANQLNLRPSPLTGILPLRRIVLRQVIEQHFEIVANRGPLQRSLDRIDRFLARLENTWSVAPTDATRTPADIARSNDLNYVIGLWGIQEALTDVERELGLRSFTVVLSPEWVQQLRSFEEAARTGTWPNPFLSQIDRRAFRQFWEWATPVAEKIIAGTFNPRHDLPDRTGMVTLPDLDPPANRP